jgi:hypothetical protein
MREGRVFPEVNRVFDHYKHGADSGEAGIPEAHAPVAPLPLDLEEEEEAADE